MKQPRLWIESPQACLLGFLFEFIVVGRVRYDSKQPDISAIESFVHATPIQGVTVIFIMFLLTTK